MSTEAPGRAVPDRGAKPRSGDRWRAGLAALAVAAGALAIDQATKAVAEVALASGPVHVGILHLRLVANRGILLGLIVLPIWLLTLVVLTVVAAALRAVWRGGIYQSMVYALLSGGAMGNLLDRYLHRTAFPPHAVVDWLSFGGMTFNLADVFVVAAAVLLLGQESGEQVEAGGAGVPPGG